MKKTKIMAAYLPQFHETEENNRFWGKGFTDWVGVKNAKPQFEGHTQPRIPLDNNYYDLSKFENVMWQSSIARKYGIDGFNIYHYWFKDGKKMLQTPAELLLEHPEVDIEYFFSWDNCSWIRSWSNIPGNAWAPEKEKNQIRDGKQILLELDYGDEEQWRNHFEYLLSFFKDPRYLKVDNKPVFAFMTSFDKKKLVNMGEYWKKLAVESGFDGLLLISRKDEFINKYLFDTQFIYQPAASAWGKRMSIEGKLNRWFGIKGKRDGNVRYQYNYEKVWKNIIREAKKQVKRNMIIGSFVSYDDTPRRGNNANICQCPESKLFEKYFLKLYEICCNNNADFMLITAWNEWGEGAYLEPDEENGYAYLEALKRAIDNVKD